MTLKGRQYAAFMAGGAGNEDAWDYVTSTDGLTDISSYGFIPVGGDVELTALEEDFDSVGADKLGYTYYQNVFYPGDFNKIHVSSGTVMYFKKG